MTLSQSCHVALTQTVSEPLAQEGGTMALLPKRRFVCVCVCVFLKSQSLNQPMKYSWGSKAVGKLTAFLWEYQYSWSQS